MSKQSLLVSMALLASSITFTIISCSKDNSSTVSGVSSNSQGVSLYLTDGPGDYEHVYVDITSVKVLVDTCSGSPLDYWRSGYRDSCIAWSDLDVKAGVYDLLALSNGVDALLANGSVPKGKIKIVKIQLGSRNSLVKDSTTYPLNLFGDTSAVLVNLRGDEWDQSVTDSSKLWIDFDVARSVFEPWKGKFYLSPVLTAFIEKNTGNIEGEVLPRSAFPLISVYNSTADTTYNIPNHDGYFKVRALKPGKYDLKVKAFNGYKDTTITGINVAQGQTSRLPAITLHK